MLYIAYVIILNGHNIKKKLQNVPFVTCRGWKNCLSNLCTH